jgi:intein/homing endonuclease
LSSKAAKAVKPATKAAKTAKLKSVCFVEGTLVETVDGHVPIEEVQAGDYVYAQDPETKEKGFKKGSQDFYKQSNELVSVFVNGEEIVTTPGHPFLCAAKRLAGLD